MRLSNELLVHAVLGLGALGLGGCAGQAEPPGTTAVLSAGEGSGSGSDSTTGGGNGSITATTIDPSDTLPNTTMGATMGGSSTGGGDTMSVDSTASDTSNGSTSSVSAGSESGSTSGSASGSTGSMVTTTTSTTTPGTTTGMMTSASASASMSGSASASSTTGSTTGMGSSSGGGCNSAAGNYDACLTPTGVPSNATCGFTGAVCINDGGTPAFASSCSLQNCTDDCDCPAGPPTGDAVVTCAEITGDTIDECYLDCSNGETCPTGMGCFIGFVCVWDSGNGPQPYDECSSNIECPPDHICIVDDTTTPTQGVCTPVGCTTTSDCPTAPATGNPTLTCFDITGEGDNDCYLDCSAGETCPSGMVCLNNFLCIWPIP